MLLRASLVASGKESTCNAGASGLMLGQGRYPGGGHGSPLQYSCLENPMDRGARFAKELDTTEVNEQEQCAFRIQPFGK